MSRVAEQRLKRPQTARTSRRSHSGSSFIWCAIWIALVSLSVSKPRETNAAAFHKTAQHLETGDYAIALEYSRRSWQDTGNSIWGWKFKAQYIEALIALGDKPEAARLLQGDLPGDLRYLRPRYEYLRGYLSRRGKNIPSSIAHLQSAIALAKKEGDAITEADALSMLADLDGSHRIDFYKRALAIAESNHLDFLEAETLCNLGEAMHDLGQFAAGVSYLTEGAAAAHRCRARWVETVIEDNLGECYLGLGDLDQALQSLQKALLQLRADDPLGVPADVNMGIGKVSALRRDNAAAVSNFTKAFSIVQSDPTLEIYVPVAQKLAAGLIEGDRPNEAEHYNDLASKALRNASTDYQVAWDDLNRADIAVKRSRFDEAERLYQRVLRIKSDELGDARWSAYARLATLEARRGSVTEAGVNFEKALAAIEDNRSQQKAAKDQISFLSALIRFYQQYVDFLVQQGKPWRALAVADSSRAGVLKRGLESSRGNPDFIDKIRQEARDSNSALLFYWLAPSPQKSYLWLLSPEGDDFKVLPDEAAIARDVDSYSNAIQALNEDPLGGENQLGIQLYKTLIAPVAAHLQKGTRVVVVPDGALHGLNFETLLVKTGKAYDKTHYLLDDFTLTVAPSLAMLLDKRRTAAPSGRALIIGDGIYSGAKYQQLSESKKEVDELAALFGKGSQVVRQREAVPDAYPKAQPGLFSFIHISGHVEADKNSPLDSAIILSPGEDGNRQLYAHVIQRTPLNADLVTISGCNSVGKKVLAGEGMVGFAWASFEAGARNAVTSLWDADDHATTELMYLFYTGVRQQGKPYAQALHDAKTQIRDKYKLPYYWAPFQLYSRNLSGSPKPVLQAKR